METDTSEIGIFMCRLCNLFSTNKARLSAHVVCQHADQAEEVNDLVVLLRPLAETQEDPVIKWNEGSNRRRGRAKGSKKSKSSGKVADLKGNKDCGKETEKEEQECKDDISLNPKFLRCSKCQKEFRIRRQLSNHRCNPLSKVRIKDTAVGNLHQENEGVTDMELVMEAVHESDEDKNVNKNDKMVEKANERKDEKGVIGKYKKSTRHQKEENVENYGVDECLNDGNDNEEENQQKSPRKPKQKKQTKKVKNCMVAVAGVAKASGPVSLLLEQDLEPGTTKIVVAVSNTEADAPSETSVSRKEGNSQEFSIHRVPAGGEQDNRQGSASQLQIFSCHHCGKIFKFKHSLQTHIRIHTQEKPFRCEQCDYASAIKSNLVVHQRKHTGEVFTCGSCTFTCRSRGHLKVHIERVHQQLKHNCAFCQKRYADVKNLMKHIRETHELQSKEVSACYAELQLQTRAGRRELLYTCAVCQRSFKSRLERDRHTLSHGLGPERPFVCELCGNVAGWRQGLYNHVRRHYFAYVCAFCGSFFVSATRLQTHLAEDHTDKAAESQPFETSLEKSFCILHPEEEQEELADGSNLEQSKDENAMVEDHIDGHLELKGSSNVMSTKPNDAIVQAETSGAGAKKKGISEQSEQLKQQPSAFRSILQELPKRSLSVALFKQLHSEFGDLECEYCGKLFWYAAHLVTHKRVHTREHPFHCPECSYTSATKNCLRRHLEQRHSAETQYCNEPSCTYSTTDKYKMQAHTRAHHFSDKTYSCPGCEKNFIDDRRFKTHVLKWHPDVPTSVLSECLGKRVQVKGGIGKRASHCPICQKLFRKGGVDLQRHIWAHQGVKPYKCQHCDYATCNQSNLRSHEERHQPDRTHLCDICGKNFKSKATLCSHKQLHTRVRRLVCGQCDYTAATKAHLQRHMEQHSTLKPFICQQCSYSCNTASTLNRHYNQKHQGFLCAARATPPQVDAAQLAAGVIKCPVCEFVYMTKWEMNRHLKNKHGMKLVQVERIRVLEANESEVSPVKVVSTEEQQTEVSVEDMSTRKTTEPLPEQALEMEPEAVQVLQQIVGPNESTDTITVLEQGYEVEHMVISDTDGVETLTMYTPVVPMSELIVYVQEAPAEDGVAETVGEPAGGEEEKEAQYANEGEEGRAEMDCERQSEPVQDRCKDSDEDVIFLKCITNRPSKVEGMEPAGSVEPACAVEEECVVGEKEEWVVCEEEKEGAKE